MEWFLLAGTTERVCLITGNVEALVTILTFIMEKVKEKPDPTLKAEFDGKNIDREKQVSAALDFFIYFFCTLELFGFILLCPT